MFKDVVFLLNVKLAMTTAHDHTALNGNVSTTGIGP